MTRERLPAGRGFPSIEQIQAKSYPERITKKSKRSAIVLALDLSTSCIGWALGCEGEVINYGKFVFTDDREMGERMAAFSEYFYALLKTYTPTRILAEKPMARRGNVTALHNQILGVIRYMAYRALRLEILDRHLVAPVTVKRLLGVPRGQTHEQNKEIMVNHINDTLGLTLKFHPNSKLQSEDDVADAIALLLASWTKRTE